MYNKFNKSSYGLALCRKNKFTKKLEILMVKKRCSYQFIDFVLGKYNIKKKNTLMNLFDNMTNDEKIDIASLDFNRIWYRVWMNNPEKDPVSSRVKNIYLKSRSKFERTFIFYYSNNPGVELISMLNQSKSNSRLWEIPKGRKELFETSLDCAIREFEEETNITSNCYKLITELHPNEISYDIGKIRYTFAYWTALATCNIKNTDRLNYQNNIQISEVVSIKWMDLDTVKKLDSYRKYYKLVKKIFKDLNMYINN